MDKVVRDQAEGLRRLLSRGGARVIAVSGGTSGVGRTTTVLNLAAALAEQGKDVLVIDEHAGLGSASAMLGGLRGAGDCAAVLRGDLKLEEAAARHPMGFAMLTARHSDMGGYSSDIINASLTDAADVVLIDALIDRTGSLSGIAKHAHDVLIVTRVAPQAHMEAYACMKRLHFTHAIAQFRVLVNHVRSVADAATAFDNLAGVARTYLAVSLEEAGCISADPQMERAQELSRCVVDAFPSTPAARDFRQVASELQFWPMRTPVSVHSDFPVTGRVDQRSLQQA